MSSSAMIIKQMITPIRARSGMTEISEEIRSEIKEPGSLIYKPPGSGLKASGLSVKYLELILMDFSFNFSSSLVCRPAKK